MLGPPIDAWYVWVGVGLVSLSVLGVAAVATPERPSNANAAAETVEQVAASRPPTTATHAIDAERIRVSEFRITIEGEKSETAIVDHGRMTPAPRDTGLRRVALGASPETVFGSARAFSEAVADAHSAERVVEPAGDRLIVRKVSYGGSHVVLVTA